jgi:hypothetical protein
LINGSALKELALYVTILLGQPNLDMISSRTYDYLVGGTPCRDGFYPFGKIVNGSQNPPVFST